MNASASSNHHRLRRTLSVTREAAQAHAVPPDASPSSSGGGASKVSGETAGSKRLAQSRSSKVGDSSNPPKRRQKCVAEPAASCQGPVPLPRDSRQEGSPGASGRASPEAGEPSCRVPQAETSAEEKRTARIARLQEMLLQVRGQVGHMVNTLASDIAREARGFRALDALKVRGR